MLNLNISSSFLTFATFGLFNIFIEKTKYIEIKYFLYRVNVIITYEIFMKQTLTLLH